MAKKKKEVVEKKDFDITKYDQHMKEQEICTMVESNYMPYAMSVIISRALPDVRDGMKPSQRKVLYTMKNMNLTPGHKSKSANIAGTTLRLNPHSDQSCYETMVRMVDNNETLLSPYVAGKGSFGKHYSRDMAFAASRYCVTGDTLISTQNGIMPIKDIISNSELGKTYNDINLTVKSINSKKNNASKFFNSGNHETYKITLANGMEITGTPNHPLLTIDKDGEIYWKLIDDICIGDKCVVDLDVSNALYGTNNDLLEAKMLGCMISEGYITTENRIGINNTDLNMINPVFEYFNREIKNSTAKINHNEKRNYYEYCIANKDFFNIFVEKYDYKKSALEKHIPQCVFEGTKEYQKEFLKYLFEGDGSVRNQKTHRSYDISYSTYSVKLVKELQILLAQSFGILSYIKKDDKEYKLMITSRSLHKFKNLIGFVSERKNNILNSIEEKRPANNSYECCIELANRIKREYHSQASYNSGYMALSFYSTYKNNDLYLLLNNYAYIEVKSKEFAGIQTVYSIKVDSDCHSFTANGFINHNTEASLSALGMELFKGINKNAIDMIDNYDGTMKEPTVLPVSFPAVLANPTLGIAVGFASNICSFNLKELCEATIEKIKHPKSTLLDIMPGPDFSTGGLILYDKDAMLDIYNTGKGPIRIRSKYTIDKKNYRIEIKEIPYSTTAEAIVESVIALCKAGKIKEINDIRDDTDKKGLTITIEYKRTYDPEQLMLKLFKMTPLEDTFSCNFNVIVDGNPRCLGVYAILDEWIKFRKQCVVRMLTFEKEELEHKLHLLRGLEKILLNIDKAIKIIKNTEKDIEVVPNLMKAFKIDEIQATYIADMKLRYINKEYILSRTAEITEVENKIASLKKQIESDAEIKKIVIADLQAIIKKFGVDRKSEIIDSSSVNSLSDEPAIAQYATKIFITEHGYIKKVPASSINEKTENKIKDDDVIKYTFEDDNLSDLLIFTDKTNVYKLKVSEIPDSKSSEFGNFIKALTGMEEKENIIYTICTKDYSGNLLLAFENGKVALFPINVYETKTNRKMLKNGFFDGSKVIFMDVVGEDTNYYIIGNNKKKKLVFTNKDVPLKTTKTTQGVQIFRLTKDTFITDCNPLKVTNKKTIEKYIPNNYPAAGR